MTTPAEKIVDKLVSAGVITAKQTDGYFGPVREGVADFCVFATLWSTDKPWDFFSSAAGTTATPLTPSRVNLQVRSNPDAFELGELRAIACRNALHLASLSGSVWCKVIRGPDFLGSDSQHRFLWSLDVQVLE